MKLGKIKLFIFLISIVSFFFLVGCDEENSPEIISVEIQPQNIIIPKGATGEYKAVAYLADGTELDVTKMAVWKSYNPCVARIQTAKMSESPFFHALIDPETVFIEENDVCKYSQSDIDVVPNISNGGYVQGIEVGETAIQVKYGDKIRNTANIKVTDAALMYVSVEMLNPTVIQNDTNNNESNESNSTSTQKLPIVKNAVPKGIDAKYRVLGIFENKMQTDLTQFATFESSNRNVALFHENYVAAGVARTVEQGVTEIRADYNGVLSDPVTLTVNDVKLESIEIQLDDNTTLPKDMVGKSKAIGAFSDKSTVDITSQVKWTSEDSTVIQIRSKGDHAGYARALKEGNTSISASFEDINSSSSSISVNAATLKSIEASPLSATVAQTLTRQYAAKGIYSDGSTYDLTDFVAWGALNFSLVRFDAKGTPGAGLARTFGAGETYVRAFFGLQYSNELALTVTDAIITSIQIIPEHLTPLQNSTANYKALAYLSDDTSEDITRLVTWFSSNPKVAKIATLSENAGYTEFRETGNAVITATFNGLTSNRSEIEVSKLESIVISPADTNISVDENLTYSTKGIYSNGTSKVLEVKELSWKSDDNTVANISDDGIARGIAAGTTSIEVTHRESGLRDITVLTVAP